MSGGGGCLKTHDRIGNVEEMTVKRNQSENLKGMSLGREGIKPRGRNNIKMGFKYADSIQVAQDTVQSPVANMVGYAFDLHKIQDISWPTKRLSDSQVDLCAMELVVVGCTVNNKLLEFC
jgi:hypothetical protein